MSQDLQYDGDKKGLLSFTLSTGSKDFRELCPNDCVYFKSPNLIVIERENGDREGIEIADGELDFTDE